MDNKVSKYFVYPNRITDVCSLMQNITEVKFDRSSGVSKSVILYGNLGAFKVVAKIFLDITQKPKDLNKYQWLKVLYKADMIFFYSDIQALRYESNLYSYITQNIIIPGYSDNFVFSLGNNDCEKKYIERDVVKTLYNIYKIPEDHNLPLGVIINQKLPDIEEAYKVYNRISPGSKEAVIFQFSYAIAVMERFKITHNDLHGGNAFIRIIDNPKKFAYVIRGKRYVINTKYIPVIFDWDFGYCEYLGPNPRHTEFMCNARGLCSRFRYLQDIYKVACQYEFAKIMNSFPTVKLDRKLTEVDMDILNKVDLYYSRTYDDEYYYNIDRKIATELGITVPPNIDKFIIVVSRKNKTITSLPSERISCYYLTSYASLPFESTLDLIEIIFKNYLDDVSNDIEKTYVFPE